MIRILFILVIGLIALNIGFGAALFKTRMDARHEILLLRDDIQSRTAFGPRPGGRLPGGRDDAVRPGSKADNRGGERDGDKGADGFGEIRRRLDLSEAQAEAFRAFLQARRDMRRILTQELVDKEQAFEQAITNEPFDRDRLKALRDDLSATRARVSEATFLKLEAFLASLDAEQRARMFELGRRTPNSLLML